MHKTGYVKCVENGRKQRFGLDGGSWRAGMMGHSAVITTVYAILSPAARLSHAKHG